MTKQRPFAQHLDDVKLCKAGSILSSFYFLFFINYYLMVYWSILLVCYDHDRPPLLSEIPVPLQTLMSDCWHRDATKRPSFREVLARSFHFFIILFVFVFYSWFIIGIDWLLITLRLSCQLQKQQHFGKPFLPLTTYVETFFIFIFILFFLGRNFIKLK